MNYTENELRLADRIMADYRASLKPDPLRGPNQTTSILPAEFPQWALKLIIVTAIVLWLTWRKEMPA
jgi:hypothetical protein